MSNNELDLDKILTKLIQLSYAPIAMEKIATGDVFEAYNEAKQQLSNLIKEIILKELKELDELGKSEMGGEMTLKGHIDYRIKELKEQL